MDVIVRANYLLSQYSVCRYSKGASGAYTSLILGETSSILLPDCTCLRLWFLSTWMILKWGHRSIAQYSMGDRQRFGPLQQQSVLLLGDPLTLAMLDQLQVGSPKRRMKRYTKE